MIPKIVHYIWIGQNEKPKNFELIYASWVKNLPGFEIIEWDNQKFKEFILPIYFFKAMEERKYAFASDVLRCHILNKYGGIYLDIDEILLKPIPLDFLKCNFFTAYYHNSKNYYGFQFTGCSPSNHLMSEMVDFYNKYNLNSKEDIDYEIVNSILSKKINYLLSGSNYSKTANYEELNEYVLKKEVYRIYPQYYFYAEMENFKKVDLAYAYHMSNTSWIPTWKKIIQKIPFYSTLKNLAKKILPRQIKKSLGMNILYK